MATCSKCNSDMDTKNYGAKISVLRCSNCMGIFAQPDSLSRMKTEWMSEVLDKGDRSVGTKQNEITDATCPVCGVTMESKVDPKQTHITYEVCPTCEGIYFDAGEFTDWKQEDVLDWFKGLLWGKKA